jgi:hypothetical protein
MARHDDDDDDDRPRSRGRDDDDDLDRPRRKNSEGGGGGKVVLIVLGVGAVLLLLCVVAGYLLILPAITKVREAAARASESNNLKQIGLGMHNHASANIRLPRADDDLSWRVHILPFIEQDNLSRQFDMKQPWNQGRNQALGDTFIKTYQSPLDDPPTSQTHYRVFTGDGSAFDTNLWKQRPFPMYITDGTSNTILVIDTAETVPWPAPKEVLLQKGGQFPDFGHPKRSQILVLTCDAAVRPVDKKALDAAKIRALATAAGNEPPVDW